MITACSFVSHSKSPQLPSSPRKALTSTKSLKSLKIVRVSLTDDALQNMIVHSPLLERLTVECCDDFCQLNINAPNLQVFRFIGNFEDISISNTTNVVDVFIRLDKSVQRRGNLLRFFAELPNIRRLYVSSKLVKYLAAGDSWTEKLPIQCLHLQFLRVTVCNDDVTTVLCLMRNSPAVEELEVLAIGPRTYDAEVGKVNSLLDDNQSCLFTRLRHVKLHCYHTVDGALELIRLLLLSSPALATMTVYKYPSVSVNGYDLAKRLLRLKRASPYLELVLTDSAV